MNTSRYFINTVALIAMLSLIPGLVVIAVDPYHIFHKPIFKNHGFDKKQLFFHAAGMINNYLLDPEEHYNAVVIGSSTASGYNQKLFMEDTDWGRTLNLSISGSNGQHHSLVAKRVLASSSIEHIFLDLSYHYAYEDYAIENFDTPQSEDPMPQYLYNQSRIDDYRYIFNKNSFITSINIIFGNFSDFNLDLEANGAWINQKEAVALFFDYSTPENIASLLATIPKKRWDLLSEPHRKAITYPTIDNRLLPTIMPYCNTGIDIVLNFSPRSRYSITQLDIKNEFYKELYMRRYLVEKTKQCKNFRFFAFETSDDISGDVRNYMDNVHFDKSTFHKILASVSQNKYRLTPENIDQYEIELINKLNAYSTDLAKSMEK